LKNTPSFNIETYIAEVKQSHKYIDFANFDAIISEVPADIKQKDLYLKLITNWFVQGVLTPLIQDFIKN